MLSTLLTIKWMASFQRVPSTFPRHGLHKHVTPTCTRSGRLGNKHQQLKYTLYQRSTAAAVLSLIAKFSHVRTSATGLTRPVNKVWVHDLCHAWLKQHSALFRRVSAFSAYAVHAVFLCANSSILVNDVQSSVRHKELIREKTSLMYRSCSKLATCAHMYCGRA
jgi:hypothetical protein